MHAIDTANPSPWWTEILSANSGLLAGHKRPLGTPLYLDLELQLPALDLPVLEQEALAAAEVLIAVDLLVAAPAEEGAAAAAGHLVAALALLDGHAAGWAALGRLLHQRRATATASWYSVSCICPPSCTQRQWLHPRVVT